MDKSELIEFETAVLAHSLGYRNENHSVCYNMERITYEGNYKPPAEVGDLMPNIVSGERPVAATQSMIQKWLREEHNIQIYVTSDTIGLDNKWRDWYWTARKGGGETRSLDHRDGLDSYQKAMEIGLQEAMHIVIKSKN